MNDPQKNPTRNSGGLPADRWATAHAWANEATNQQRSATMPGRNLRSTSGGAISGTDGSIGLDITSAIGTRAASPNVGRQDKRANRTSVAPPVTSARPGR